MAETAIKSKRFVAETNYRYRVVYESKTGLYTVHCYCFDDECHRSYFDHKPAAVRYADNWLNERWAEEYGNA